MKARNIFRGIATILAITIILPCVVTTKTLADTTGIQTFVTSLYSDCLGRTPDPVGLNDWCTKLANGSISGKECAYGFFFSPEFRAKAEVMPAGGLVDTYYRVFLNRSADADGKAYWMQKIASTPVSDDIIILFTGFADSTEFAQKCASYGITVGTVNLPAVSTGGGASSAPATSATDTWTAVQNGSYHFGSASEMDAYFANRGCVVYNIYLGQPFGFQKVYVQFFDTTAHAQMVNQHRINNGQAPLEMVTNPNDPRMQETRLRAVEAAYNFCHYEPCVYGSSMNGYNEIEALQTRGWYAWSGEENITSVACENSELTNQSFQNFVNSPGHNANMLKPATIFDGYDTVVMRASYAVASCKIWVVASDGVSINPNGCTQNRVLGNYTMPNGFGTATVQNYYGETYDIDWSSYGV